MLGSLRKFAGVSIVAVAGALAIASPVFAHNSLASSDPADGATLGAAPSTWTLTFNKSVPLSSASGEVVGGDGVRTDLGPARHGASDKVIVFTVPPVQGPTMTFRWRLVSTDGHVISGRVRVTVPLSTTTTLQSPSPTSTIADGTTTSTSIAGPASTVPPDTGVAEPDRSMREALSWLLRFAEFTAGLALIGALFVERFVVRGSIRLVTVGRLVRTTLVILGTTAGMQLFVFAADFANVPLTSSFGSIPDALGTQRGLSLAVKLLAVGVLSTLLWSVTTRRRATGMAELSVGAAVMVYLSSIAFGGHARSAGWAVVGVPVDVLHVVTASAWIGGLWIVLMLVRRHLNDYQSVHALARFSRLAPALVITIAVSGSIQTIRIHGGLGHLLTSDHGRTLLVKVSLVIALLGFGYIHRRALEDVGSLTRDDLAPLRDRLWRTVIGEAALGLVVVAVTATLVTSSYSG